MLTKAAQYNATLPPPDEAERFQAILERFIPNTRMERARRIYNDGGGRLDTIAVKLGLISDGELAQAYAQYFGTPLLALNDYPSQPVAADRLQASFFGIRRLLPLAETADSLTIAMADPFDHGAVAAMAFASKQIVNRRIGLPSEIEAAIQRLYRPSGGASTSAAVDGRDDRPDEDRDADLGRLRDLASEAPVIRFVNSLIGSAVEMRASDLHIEAVETGLRVRYRIDGVLRDAEPPPPRLKSAIISRIKIMAHLDIAERRLAQDGRLRHIVRGQEIDLRVSTTPAIHGESVVLRILDRTALSLDFRSIGFDDDLLPRWRDICHRPHGVVLVTGPTGSGKTTTLYTSLRELNDAQRKILTVEDPIEYVLAGVSQVQVKPQIGLTFAAALRSFLRQDPDIMLIGEIRDLETAQISIQAALTGHLVLSTVHTNDAASAVTRLIDMGVESYLLPSTIAGVLAQRLVRVLCASCKEAYTAPAELFTDHLLELGGAREVILYHARGCDACGHSGYRGRTMILELMEMTNTLRPLILRRADAAELKSAAIADGMQTMHIHGLRKALAGVTTLEEVGRVIRDH